MCQTADPPDNTRVGTTESAQLEGEARSNCLTLFDAQTPLRCAKDWSRPAAQAVITPGRYAAAVTHLRKTLDEFEDSTTLPPPLELPFSNTDYPWGKQ
jgi:hypothetical protein